MDINSLGQIYQPGYEAPSYSDRYRVPTTRPEPWDIPREYTTAPVMTMDPQVIVATPTETITAPAPTVTMYDPSQIQSEQALMQKWGADSIEEANHIEYWVTDPVGFARDAVTASKTPGIDTAVYIATIQEWIRKHTAQELYGPFFDQMDIGTLGEFGWTFLPEFKDYYWGRHAAWNTNDFIQAISKALPAIADPEIAADYRTRTLAALELWGPAGWKARLPAGLKVEFLKTYYPEEIQAAAIASKMAQDKARLIGISVVALIGGTLFFSIGGKRPRRRTTVKR